MRITQRQLRQIIKEELNRTLRETHEPEYGDSAVSDMPVTSGTGRAGFTTSMLQDGAYTWEIAISPDWSQMKPGIVADLSVWGFDAQPQYGIKHVLDSFQISLVGTKPGARLPGGLTTAELPYSMFADFVESDGRDKGPFDYETVLPVLERRARSQGKTNLADNIKLVKDAIDHALDI